MVLLRTQNKCKKAMGKKIFTILRWKVLLIYTCDVICLPQLEDFLTKQAWHKALHHKMRTQHETHTDRESSKERTNKGVITLEWFTAKTNEELNWF